MRELSLNVMDIAQNSISAGASLITLTVEEDRLADTLSISVEDNGRGLPPELMGPYTGPPETSGRGHLGLYNVDTILNKHYGEAYGLRLGSRPGGPGAAVTASLPLWKEEEIC